MTCVNMPLAVWHITMLVELTKQSLGYFVRIFIQVLWISSNSQLSVTQGNWLQV
jgi:hypothetical protein